jgi:galactokinase
MKRKEVEAVAHGRVNLIGEHTDYNGGFVLPTCIPQSTHVRVRRRDDRVVVSTSHERDGMVRYHLGEELAQRQWGDYIQGVTAILASEGLAVGGFECHFSSSIPIGSGLSSSAALEVSLLKGLNELFELDLDGVRIARLGQKVENDFVGARVGIMDQMICSLGQLGEALFIDTRDLTTRRLTLPLTEMELLVISSGVFHSNSQGGYNQRRRECEDACRLLGVKELRDVTMDDMPKIEKLPKVSSRRARHVVSESDRVLKAVEALEARDFSLLGDLFLASHRSMRSDYEVSVPEIDLLVDLTMSHQAAYGARLTGGGFGGSIVGLTRPGHAGEIGEQVLREYKNRTGRTATVLIPAINLG